MKWLLRGIGICLYLMMLGAMCEMVLVFAQLHGWVSSNDSFGHQDSTEVYVSVDLGRRP